MSRWSVLMIKEFLDRYRSLILDCSVSYTLVQRVRYTIQRYCCAEKPCTDCRNEVFIRQLKFLSTLIVLVVCVLSPSTFQLSRCFRMFFSGSSMRLLLRVFYNPQPPPTPPTHTQQNTRGVSLIALCFFMLSGCIRDIMIAPYHPPPSNTPTNHPNSPHTTGRLGVSLLFPGSGRQQS